MTYNIDHACDMQAAEPATSEEAGLLAGDVRWFNRLADQENDRAGWPKITEARRIYHRELRDRYRARAKAARNRLTILQAAAAGA